MKRVIIVGSGIAGLMCAMESAHLGNRVFLASPMASERSGSVLAWDGISAALDTAGEADSPELHIEDTWNGGHKIEDVRAVEGLCRNATHLIRRLEEFGVMFERDHNGKIDLIALSGNSRRRSAHTPGAVGKQLVGALARVVRQYEATGIVRRRTGVRLLSLLTREGVTYGAAFLETGTGKIYTEYADAVILATGGQSSLLGASVGSVSCDGWAAAHAFQKGARLKNLEFVEFCPTAFLTPQKPMVIPEEVRVEGGRLFYNDQGRRLYFMEEKFGPGGNVMPADIISREMALTGNQVYLDISFLPPGLLGDRFRDLCALCRQYGGIDVTKDPIPVTPWAHYFLGGLKVDRDHRTNLERLYAIGECASIYHGAKRIGGNSLLSAIYGGNMAAIDVMRLQKVEAVPDFSAEVRDIFQAAAQEAERQDYSAVRQQKESISRIMAEAMGCIRNEAALERGLSGLEDCRQAILEPEPSVCLCGNLWERLSFAEAVLRSALGRRESRGVHYREDFPQQEEAFACTSVMEYREGRLGLSFQKDEEVMG